MSPRPKWPKRKWPSPRSPYLKSRALSENPKSLRGKAEETIEEIRFYLAHGMPEQAMAALAKLQTVTNDRAKLAELRAEVEAATTPAAEETPVEPKHRSKN